MTKFSIACLLLIVFIFCTLPTHARKKEKIPPVVWKKLVTRVIDTRDTLDDKGHLHHSDFGDSVLIKFLADGALKGNFIAYDNYNTESDHFPPLSREELFERMHPKDDTFCAEDHKEIMHYPKWPSSKDVGLKTLEEWTFNPVTLFTQIQIIAIAPIKEYYSDDGFYKGSAAIFWLKWEDIKEDLKWYSKKHSRNNFQRYLTDDYFKYNEVHVDSNQDENNDIDWYDYYRTAIRTIIVDDTTHLEGHIEYMENTKPLTKILYKNIKESTLPAFSYQKPFLRQMLKGSDIKIWRDDDTVYFEDEPELEGPVEIVHGDVDWNNYKNYRFLESWSFNSNSGITSIKVKAISPSLDRHERLIYNDPNPPSYTQLFWVKYKDIKNILADYDSWHPLNNFSTNLWNSYFKAEELKQ